MTESLYASRMEKIPKSFIREILKVTEDPQVISFAGGLPNPRFFPTQAIAQAARDSENAAQRIPFIMQTGQGLLTQFTEDEALADGSDEVRQERLLERAQQLLTAEDAPLMLSSMTLRLPCIGNREDLAHF